MEKIETVQQFKRFLDSNRDKLLEHAIKVEELPPDDEWVQDDGWDEVYEQELLNNEFHEFSLVAVKNPTGKYLQKYDNRWNCWLFPYIKTTENNKENVDKYISGLFQMPIDTCYIAQAKHCKYSESDSVYKIYNHKLYGVLLTQIPETMLQDEFYVEDVKYRWMSIAELEQNENAMKKNDDVIAFVKSKYL